MRLSRRTTVATILLTLAVLAPTVAWFISGSRDTARRAIDIREAILGSASSSLSALASHLAGRLENLRLSESERPFYHYQSLYHDPRGAAEGLSVAPSPLASGIRDPIVKAYFQIDASGSVTLPTLNEQFPELSAEDGFAVYCSFLDALREGHLIQPSERTGSDPQQIVTPDLIEGPRPADLTGGERILILERAAWEQNLRANSVYGVLTGRQTGEPVRSPQDDGDNVVIGIGPLSWNTLILGSGPVLAALRQVATPNGVLVQGFAVDHQTLLTEAVDPNLEVSIDFGTLNTGAAVTARIESTDWSLAADVSELEREASARESEMKAEFRYRFLVTSLAVSLAAMAVIWILIQTENLARQRARFAAAAAHELRTPIASLRLYAEMLRDGLGDPKHGKQYASRLAEESARLGRVVTNMLDLARLERGALQVEAVPGDLAEAIETAVDRHRRTYADAGVDIVLDIEELDTLAIFDPD
ncbi:MAG: HAMP domain-containing histidine kinase, partial [bacterium]|nr:HAMP domain-containing histidine kinase [bacterium]